MINTLNKT